jgi:hypothetical protein
MSSRIGWLGIDTSRWLGRDRHVAVNCTETDRRFDGVGMQCRSGEVGRERDSRIGSCCTDAARRWGKRLSGSIRHRGLIRSVTVAWTGLGKSPWAGPGLVRRIGADWTDSSQRKGSSGFVAATRDGTSSWAGRTLACLEGIAWTVTARRRPRMSCCLDGLAARVARTHDLCGAPRVVADLDL